MNLVGKILTVLILVMGLVFMALALTVYSTHTNWHTEYKKLDSDYTALEGTNSTLQTEKQDAVDKLDVDTQSFRRQIARLERQRQDDQNSLQTLTSEYDEAAQENATLNAAVITAQNNMRALTEEVQALRDEVRNERELRNTNFNNLVTALDEVADLSGDLGIEQERRREFEERIVHMTRKLRANSIDPTGPVDNVPPSVDGEVMEVGKRNLIEISLGTDDGLRKGHKVHVFRGRQYKGKAEILEIEPDKAVAKILRAFRRGIIQKGDRVATKLTKID